MHVWRLVLFFACGSSLPDRLRPPASSENGRTLADHTASSDLISARRHDDPVGRDSDRGSNVTSQYDSRRLTATSSFIDHSVTTSTDGARQVIAVDIDADNDTDVLVASYYSDKVQLFLNDGSQTFTSQLVSYAEDSGPYSIAVDDFTKDGNLDIAAAFFDSNEVKICISNGGSFASSKCHVVAESVDGASFVVANDIDQDGFVDCEFGGGS